MEIIKPRTLSGFMELLPDKQIRFETMVDILRRTYASYGFAPLDTPAIEDAQILLAKGGGETEKQIYRFQKGDSDLALRFDLTVPLAKYVALHYNELAFPFRRYQISKVYRGERAQRGRFREFYQADIDIIGDGKLDILNEAEIPAIIYKVFRGFGLTRFQIRVNNRKILTDLLIYDIFNLLQFFCCHGREVCKVETQSLCIVQRPCLFYMISEYHAKSFLKQMRCTVIVLSKCTILFVNFQHYLVTDFDHTFCNLSDMAEFITCKLHNIFHYKFAVFCTDHAFISFLSTHRRIERSLSSNNRSFISVCQCIYHFCLTCHSCYFRFHFQLVISNKFRR